MLQSQRNSTSLAVRHSEAKPNPMPEHIKTEGDYASAMAALATAEREARRKKGGIDKTGTQHARATVAAKRRVQVLACVREHGPIRTADICKRLYLSCFSVVSGDLRAMREDGLVDFYRDGPHAFWVACDV